MFSLILGDCLEQMHRLHDHSVDLVIADLPYGTTQCRWDQVIDLERYWEQINRIAKQNAPIVMFAAQPFTSLLVCSNLKQFRYDWVWRKPIGTGHLNAKRQPLRDKEDILVFSKKPHLYRPQMSIGKPYKQKGGKVAKESTSEISGAYKKGPGIAKDNDGYRYPKQVLEFTPIQRGNVHPTQKPIDLLEYLIKTYSNEGDLVLDPTMGSGSTGVACVKTSRKFIGIELDQSYFDIASARINQALESSQVTDVTKPATLTE